MEDMRMMTSAKVQKLEKESKKPTANATNIPENFTWANANHAKCPLGTIRDQSNCGGCWVKLFY